MTWRRGRPIRRGLGAWWTVFTLLTLMLMLVLQPSEPVMRHSTRLVARHADAGSTAGPAPADTGAEPVPPPVPGG